MDFISIGEALSGMADRIPTGEESVKYVEVAANFHQTLSNLQGSPRWAMRHKVTGKPIFNDSASVEGMEILERAASEYAIATGLFDKHESVSIVAAGINDPDSERLWKARHIDYVFIKATYIRASQIGFGRAELIAFLDENDVVHSLSLLVSGDLQGEQPKKAEKGITKKQVLIAFGSLVSINLSKALGNGTGLFGDGRGGARVVRGTRGGKHVSLWNPVILAVGLNEKYNVPMLKLKRAFLEHNFLSEWSNEWSEKLELLGL